MSARLTVLIPTHGRPTLLARTLASVAACARPPGYAGCVVVENGPASGAEAVVAEAAAAHPEAGFGYLHHERANKSAALNAALSALSAEPSSTSSGIDAEAGVAPEGEHLVVFFDDDVRVFPGVLAAYAEAGAAHGVGAVFGGPVACDYEEAPPAWLLDLLPPSARGVDAPEAERMGYFLGINWSAWVADLVSVGGFDPAYGPGSPTGARGQESEMQRRLRGAGARMVFVPEAGAYHFVPAERCSPEWAVRRNYQSGLRMGVSARTGAGASFHRRALSELVESVSASLWSRLRNDRASEVTSRARAAQWLGYLAGYIRTTA